MAEYIIDTTDGIFHSCATGEVAEELRKCLNAAGLSDCGENDTWNYWYQRLMNAYNESVERQIMTEQAENAELRELVRDMYMVMVIDAANCDVTYPEQFEGRMRDLGIEVDA